MVGIMVLSLVLIWWVDCAGRAGFQRALVVVGPACWVRISVEDVGGVVSEEVCVELVELRAGTCVMEGAKLAGRDA